MTRSGRAALLLAAIALAAASARGQEPFVEKIPNAYRDLTRSPSATQVPLTGEDDSGVQLLIGFPFTFYGQTYTQLGVTTEGYLTFGAAVSPLNTRLPQASPPDGVVAPFWDDLDMRGAQAKVLIERTGAAGARALVVQWEQVAFKADPAARLSFQVVLFEGGSEAHLLYGEMRNGDGSRFMGRAGGSSATIGFEAGDGQRAVQLAFNQAGALTPTSAWALVTSPALPEGRLLGDLDGDGRVSILDQSRQVELDSPRYRPGTTLELVAADVAPQSSNGEPCADGRLDDQDRDVVTLALVDRVGAWPSLSATSPASPAVGETLTLTGSGFDPSAASKNVVVLTRTGGGTLELPAATVNAQGSRLTVVLPAEARRGPAFVRVGGQRTHARTLGVRAIPAVLAVTPPVGLLGQAIQVTGAEFPAALGDVQVTVGGLPAVLIDNQANPDGTRTLVVQVPAGLAPGSHPVVVTALGMSGEPAFHRFGDLPIAVLLTPTVDQQVGDLLEVRGTATDLTDFASYRLILERMAPGSGESDRKVIASGTAPVVSGALGTLDPTILINGFYALELMVTDALGTEKATRTEPIQVAGDQKLGALTLSFVDLLVPVAGISVGVTRSYDSREKRSLDFGFGWRLTYSTVDLEEDATHNVYANMADGRRSFFRFTPQPTGNPSLFRVRFIPEPGVFDTLTVPGVQDVFLNFGRFFTLAGEEFDPDDYVLTLKEGTVLEVNDRHGLTRMVDLNGNQVTFAPSGVTHNAGVAIGIDRDASGRVERVADPAGGTLTYEYDAQGDLVAAANQAGRRVGYVYAENHFLRDLLGADGVRVARSEYDADGRLVGSIDADGRRTSVAHDLAGRRLTVTNRLGHQTVTEFAANGDVLAVTDHLGRTTRYEYDAARNQTAVVDSLGQRITSTFDAQGNRLTQIDPLGHTTTWTYAARGLVATETDARGHRAEYTYDDKANLVAERDRSGAVTSITYDARGLVRTVTDPSGAITGFDYTKQGLLSLRIDAHGRHTGFRYDKLGNRTVAQQGIRIDEHVFNATRMVQTQYDASGRAVVMIDPLGKRSTIEYAPNGVKQSAIVDAAGHRTAFAYTPHGLLSKTTHPDGTTTHSEYDAEGRLTASLDQEGRRTEFTLNVAGQPTNVHFPDGTSVATEYDSIGRVTTTTNARGGTTTYEYDAAGRVTRVVDALGKATHFEIDEVGNVTAVRDANGHTVRLEYDPMNRLTTTRFEDGTAIVTMYDALGRPTSQTDQAGVVVRVEYDALGRHVKTIDGEGGETVFTHDEHGNVLARTDPEGRVTRFAYNAAGWLVSTTRPMGMSQTWSYDDIGRVTSFTDFTGQAQRYEYDAASRLKKKFLPDGRTVEITYTATGQRETISDSIRGVTRYSYDARDRLLTRIDPDGVTVSHEYDGNGNRTATISPSGRTQFTFDLLDRLETVTPPWGGTSRYAYDAVGSRTSLTYPGGVTEVYAYDAQRRLTGVTAKRPDSSTISSYTYELGLAGNRTSVVERDGRAVQYAYDRNYRLKLESIFEAGASGPTAVGYRYDRAGNRRERTVEAPDGTRNVTSFALDANDRLLEEVTTRGTEVERATYEYDQNGSLLRTVAPTRTTTYTWTAERRLATATIVPTAGASISLAFAYDEDGIRTERRRGADRVRFVVDDSDGFAQVVEEVDPSTGATLVAYAYGAQRVSQRRGTTERFYLHDGQHSARDLVDAGGLVERRRTFDAFGIALTSVGSADDMFGFAGEQEDADLGTYYLRARSYSPATGRFLCEDFVGTPDEPPFHRYIYADGDPVNRLDPSGLVSAVERVQTTAMLAAISVIHFVNANQGLVAVVTIVGSLALPQSVLDSIQHSGLPQPLTRTAGVSSTVRRGAGTILAGLAGATFKFSRRVIGTLSYQKGKVFEEFVEKLLSGPGRILQREPVFEKAAGGFLGLRAGGVQVAGRRVADFLLDFVDSNGQTQRWIVEIKTSVSLGARELDQLDTFQKAAAASGRQLVYFFLEDPDASAKAAIQAAGGRVVSFL